MAAPFILQEVLTNRLTFFDGLTTHQQAGVTPPIISLIDELVALLSVTRNPNRDLTQAQRQHLQQLQVRLQRAEQLLQAAQLPPPPVLQPPRQLDAFGLPLFENIFDLIPPEQRQAAVEQNRAAERARLQGLIQTIRNNPFYAQVANPAPDLPVLLDGSLEQARTRYTTSTAARFRSNKRSIANDIEALSSVQLDRTTPGAIVRAIHGRTQADESRIRDAVGFVYEELARAGDRRITAPENANTRLNAYVNRETRDPQIGVDLLRSVFPEDSILYRRASTARGNQLKLLVPTYLLGLWPSATRLLAAISISSNTGLIRFSPFEFLPYRQLNDIRRRDFDLSICDGSFFTRNEAQRREYYAEHCYVQAYTNTGNAFSVYPIEWLSVIHDMNRPVELARALFILQDFQAVYDPASTLDVTFKVYTKRYFADGDGELQPSWHMATVPIPPRQLRITTDLSLQDILRTLMEEIYGVLYGARIDSSVLNAADGLYISELQIMANLGNGTPNPLLQGAGLRSQFSPLLRIIVQELRAYSIPPEWLKQFKNVSLRIPYTGAKDDCVMESLVFLEMLKEGVPEDTSIQRAVMQQKLNGGYRAVLSSHQGKLYESIVAFLMVTESPSLNERGFVLCFFPGFGEDHQAKLAVLPPSRVKLVDNELIIQPLTVEERDALSLKEVIMMYGQGHVWIATWLQYLSVTTGPTRRDLRMDDFAHKKYPDPYLFKPVQYKPLPPLTKVRFDPTGAHTTAYTMKNYCGYYNQRYNIDKFSADVETDTCEVCGIEEVFCITLAWYPTISGSVTFTGQECKERAKGATFHTFDGAVTQFLRFIMEKIGFFDPTVTSSHASAALKKVYVYFFNGARFDHWFMLTSIRYWNFRYQMIEVGGGLGRLDWGNVSFIDFALLYRGSLADLFQVFLSGKQHADVPIPRSEKWKVFPYGLIKAVTRTDENIYTEALFTQDDIWGGKKVDTKDPRPIGIMNHEYWISEHGSVFTKKTLEAYCRDDVLILQYMVGLDHYILSTSEVNGRIVDVGDAMTASQIALKTFQQGYLNMEITTPDLSTPTGFSNGKGESYNLDELFEMAYKGGMVQVLRHTPFKKSQQPLWDRLKETENHTRKIYFLDANSCYPAAMTGEIPITLSQVKVYFEQPVVASSSTIKETDLYCASIQYPPNKFGFMVKFNGYCVSPNFIPHQWSDDYTQKQVYNLAYGVELLQALDEGATVTLYAEIQFNTAPIFKDYVEKLYSERAASSDELIRMILKLKLNSLYGKTGQKLKAQRRFFNNYIDFCAANIENWVSFDTAPGPYGEGRCIMIETVNTTKSHIGQMKYIAAFITSVARSRLNAMRAEVQKLYTKAGTPCLALYMDTDSVKFDEPDPEHPSTKAFFEKYVHSKRLGAWKVEEVTDAVIYAARKLGAWHVYDEERPVQNPYDLDELIERDPKEFDFISKGIPKKRMERPLTYSDLHNLLMGDTVQFQLPMSFEGSIERGIVKVTDATRSITLKNYTLQDPNEDGDLLPHPTLDHFRQHLERKMLNK